MSIYNNPDEKSLYQNHHVIEGARILSTDKFFCEEINSIVISNMVNKLAETFISENCLKTQLLIGVKLTCHSVYLGFFPIQNSQKLTLSQ